MLANLISDAVRLAPRFANEDGELLFDHLTTKFPDAATDAVMFAPISVNVAVGA